MGLEAEIWAWRLGGYGRGEGEGEGEEGGDQNVQLAAGRRRAWGMEEERARGEREANWLATVTGRDIVRRGRFWGN